MKFIYMYGLIFLTCFIAISIILTNKAIHSVLYLILVYFNTALLYMMIGAEYISILMLIIYVGAIAILFLFIVMMLDVRIVELYGAAFKFMPIGITMSVYFIVILCCLIVSEIDNGLSTIKYNVEIEKEKSINNLVILVNIRNNITTIGEMLYNNRFEIIIMVGILLLVTIVGVIMLSQKPVYNSLNT
jgi:NADH-quinone oxidoreductase subunit J